MNNNRTRTAFIIAASLFGAGALIFLLVSIAAGFDYKALSTGFYRTESGRFVQSAGVERTLVEKTFEASNQEILLDVVSDDIRVSPSKDGKIHLSYYNRGDLYFDLQESDRYIRLSQKGKTGFSFGFGFHVENEVVELQLPETHGGALELRLASGDCTLHDLTLSKNLTLGAVSGSLHLKDCAAAFLSVSTVSGEQRLEDFKATGLSASSVSGDILVRGCGAGLPATLSTTSGELRLENLMLSELDASTVSGDMDLSGVSGTRAKLDTASGDVQLSAGDFPELIFSSLSGSLQGSVKGASEDYTVFTETLSRGNSLAGHRGRGARILDLSSTSGSFNLRFDD